jgi:hypothetical protein
MTASAVTSRGLNSDATIEAPLEEEFPAHQIKGL